MSSALRVLALVVLLVVGGLVHGIVDASRRVSGREPMLAIHCDKANQRVLVSALGQVWMLGEDGRTLGHLHDTQGPVHFEMTSSIAVDADSRVWVTEGGVGRISRFHADGRLDQLVRDRPEPFRHIVQPLDGGRFVVGSAELIRLYDVDGRLARRREVSWPSDFLTVPGGFVVLSAGLDQTLAFDENLEHIEVPAALADVPNQISRRHIDSVYQIDVDGAGAFYFTSCPNEKRCKVLRRLAPGDPVEKLEYLAAERWFADNDKLVAGSAFCATSDGRVLLSSQTHDAVIEFEGSVIRREPVGLKWKTLRGGIPNANGVSIRLFGDEAFLGYLEPARRYKKVLRHRIELGRKALGGVLAVLMVVYLFDRLLGRHGGVRKTLLRSVRVFHKVLLPDAVALVLWLLPAVGLLGAVAALSLWLVRLDLASLVNALVFVIWVSLWMKRLTAASRLAPRRRADTARHAYELYLGDATWSPLPPEARPVAELASFAAPAKTRRQVVAGEKADTLVEKVVADNPFEIVDVLEGGLYLVVRGDSRLMWFPCQLGGKPRGVVRVASVAPTAASMPSSGHALDLPGGRLEGVDGELVARLSERPSHGPVTELCEECGRQVTGESRNNCSHYRNRNVLAVVLALLLPGLGHLVLRRFHRGRWLAIAAILLLVQLLYPFLVQLYQVGGLYLKDVLTPIVLYLLVWWISVKDVLKLIRQRRNAQKQLQALKTSG